MIRRFSFSVIIIAIIISLIPTSVFAADLSPVEEPPRPPVQVPDEWPDPEYLEAIARTSEMVWDEEAIRLAEQYGLEVLNVTWEDTGRYYELICRSEYLGYDDPGAISRPVQGRLSSDTDAGDPLPKFF